MEPESLPSDLAKWEAFFAEFNVPTFADEQDTTNLHIITQVGNVVRYDIHAQFNATDGKFIKLVVDKE